MPEPQASWFAVLTKPRQERIAQEHLCRQSFECFLPLAVNPYQKRSKKNKPLIEPLFPRYLFIRAIPEVQNLAPVRSTRGVNGMVRFGTKLVAVPKEIINSVKSRICAETGLVQLDPVAVKPGDKVKVFDGPLAGLKGILQERCSETRSILLLKILGRETTVKVNSLLLQKL